MVTLARWRCTQAFDFAEGANPCESCIPFAESSPLMLVNLAILPFRRLKLSTRPNSIGSFLRSIQRGGRAATQFGS
jgi:hypothetical protein